MALNKKEIVDKFSYTLTNDFNLKGQFASQATEVFAQKLNGVESEEILKAVDQTLNEFPMAYNMLMAQKPELLDQFKTTLLGKVNNESKEFDRTCGGRFDSNEKDTIDDSLKKNIGRSGISGFNSILESLTGNTTEKFDMGRGTIMDMRNGEGKAKPIGSGINWLEKGGYKDYKSAGLGDFGYESTNAARSAAGDGLGKTFARVVQDITKDNKTKEEKRNILTSVLGGMLVSGLLGKILRGEQGCLSFGLRQKTADEIEKDKINLINKKYTEKLKEKEKGAGWNTLSDAQKDDIKRQIQQEAKDEVEERYAKKLFSDYNTFDLANSPGARNIIKTLTLSGGVHASATYGKVKEDAEKSDKRTQGLMAYVGKKVMPGIFPPK